MLIRVADVIGNIAITAQDGEVLREQIAEVLDAGKSVELDFEGVSFFASPFFNASMGKLLEHHEATELGSRVQARSLPSDAREIMARVMKNAADFYANEATRTAVSASNDALDCR